MYFTSITVVYDGKHEHKSPALISTWTISILDVLYCSNKQCNNMIHQQLHYKMEGQLLRPMNPNLICRVKLH